MQSLIIISDYAAAAVFSSARQRLIVQTLIGKELTLSALARANRTSLSLLHYHVSKCTELGLIEIAREQSRAGRALKFYRATAKTVFVPAELIVGMPGTGLTQKLRESLDQNLTRSLQGINFTHDGRRPRVDLVRDQSEQMAAIELWLDVGLDSTTAAELAADLQAVANRFRARGNEQSQRHLVHLAMVKVPD